MLIISREQAICLFYTVAYNKENVEKYSKIIDTLRDVDICYTKCPKRPRLLCTNVILANIYDINLYISENCQEIPKKEKDQSHPQVEISELQIGKSGCQYD